MSKIILLKKQYLQFATLNFTFFLILSCVFVFPVNANNSSSSQNKFYFRLGNLNIDSVSSTIRADSSTGVAGVNLDFADDLGLRENLSLPRLDGFYRFNSRHSVNFVYYQFARRAQVIIDEDINFADTTFDQDRLVTTSLKNKVLELSYLYSSFVGNKASLNIGFGFQFDDIKIRLNSVTTNTAIVEMESESVDELLLFPVFIFSTNYKVNKRFSYASKVKQFFIDTSELEGVFSEFEISSEYKVSERLALGLSLSVINTDIESNGKEIQGEYEDTAKSVFTYLSVYF